MNEPSRDAIRRALDCGRPGCPCGRGRNTHCPGPSHRNGDRDPSLTVDERDGKVLFDCKGGCDKEAVLAELQERDLWPRPGEREPEHQQEPLRIVATYDYHYPDGKVAFQVTKKEGWAEGKRKKTYSQRHPDGRGGWIYKKGDTSILYRLPSLLASDPSELVWLCEGEKDADRLMSLGLTATTRAEGAGKWLDSNSRWLADRRVAVLEDNDEAGEKDVKKKLASLELVAKRAVRVALPNLPPGGDVSDWLDAGGAREQLLAIAEDALSAAPATDVRLLPPVELVKFPTDVLSPSLAALIRAGSASLRAPAEFIGLPLLVLAGATIGNAWEIALKNQWREGSNLYAAIVAEPGGKKTPSLKIACRPIFQVQNSLARTFRKREADYKEEMALFERSPKSARGTPPEPPKFPHVWTSDPTTEALADRLSGSKGMALIRDELVSWVRSMDIYHGGKGADRQHYLSMWSRTEIKIDRKSNPVPIIVERPCLSVIGGIQPDMLPELVESSGGNDGFLDRLLWAYPDDDSINLWTEADIDESVTAQADRLFLGLYELEGAEMPDGDVVPRVVRLDASAKDEWVKWHDPLAILIKSGDLPPSLQSPWSKLDGQLARIVLILHVTDAVDAGLSVPFMVQKDTVMRGIRLIEFFMEHAKLALASVRMKRSDLDERLLRALTDRGPCTTTQLYEALGRRIKADRLRGALEQLEEDVLVTSTPIPRGPAGGRPGRRWMITEEESDARQSRAKFPRKTASR